MIFLWISLGFVAGLCCGTIWGRKRRRADVARVVTLLQDVIR